MARELRTLKGEFHLAHTFGLSRPLVTPFRGDVVRGLVTGYAWHTRDEVRHHRADNIVVEL
jgi:hypothetical protein